MRILAYKLLTQAIIVLGNLRASVTPRRSLKRRDERCYDVLNTERWSCCDCGLTHEFNYFGPEHDCGHELGDYVRVGFKRVGHAWPIRPTAYDYTWRKGTTSSPLAIPRISPPPPPPDDLNLGVELRYVGKSPRRIKVRKVRRDES